MQIENAYLYKGMQKVRKWALFWRLKFYLNFEKNSWISISNFSSVQKSTDEIEWYTLRTPDVSGHHCPCHISLSRFCPDFPKILFGVCCLDSVRVFCPGSVCLDSVGCLDSVRICVKKTVRYLSVRIFGLDFVRCLDYVRTFQKTVRCLSVPPAGQGPYRTVRSPNFRCSSPPTSDGHE